MVRHPNVDVMPNANIDGHKIATQRDDVGAKSANSHSQFHRAGMGYAGVCAQRDDTFNAWQFEKALSRFFVYLWTLLVNQAVFSYLAQVSRYAVGFNVAA